jgi:hypothetical protein
MAVKKKSRRAASNNGETQSEARLTPPEEKEGARKPQNAAGNGTLPVNTGELKLPQELAEDETEGPLFQHVDPAVLVILCCALIFIAVIAYVVWSGWEPPK